MMNNELKAYKEYKNSKQEWLGRIPSHWKEAKSKRLFRETSNKNFPKEELLSATQNKGVIPRSMLKTRVVMPMGNLETFKLVEEGNFVISLRSFQGGLEYSKYRGIVSPAYNVLEEKSGQNRMYYKHLFKSYDFIGELQRNVTGIRQGKNIDVNDFKEIILPIPPRPEQDQIVKYLDFQLAKINKFIKAKKKMTAALKEQKQAVINEAVTKGINPDVKMKPSGIEWLGDVPEHWNVLLNKRIFKENNRVYTGGNEIQLSLSQKDGLIPSENMKEKSLQTSTYENWKITLPGDLVLNRFKAHLGVFFCAKLRGIVTFHYGVYQPIVKLSTLYFEHLFHSNVYKNIFAGRSNGMTVGLQNLSNQNFYNAYAIFPPINEQEEIVKYIEKQNFEIDNTISKIQQEIDLITEYRIRLISDVVTGKVDVRNIVIDEVISEDIPEFEDEEEVNIEEASDIKEDDE